MALIEIPRGDLWLYVAGQRSERAVAAKRSALYGVVGSKWLEFRGAKKRVSCHQEYLSPSQRPEAYSVISTAFVDGTGWRSRVLS